MGMEEEQLFSSLEDLQVQSFLGRGTKGVVFLVKLPRSRPLALKVISREELMKKKNGKSRELVLKQVLLERDFLKMFDHPLLPKFRGEIVTDVMVGLAIDYCPGGDLRTLLERQTEKMFSCDNIRFYAAEIVLALEYLHGLNIVYRDLKPDNIMIQETGHVMIVDFDICTKLSPKPVLVPQPANTVTTTDRKALRQKYLPVSRYCKPVPIQPVFNNIIESVKTEKFKSMSMAGTEHYISPEILLRKGHDYSADWWGLGIMLYEMLYGKHPFSGNTPKETFDQILEKEPNLVGDQTALIDLIAKLLNKDPLERITLEGIKSHRFFEGVDWETILDISRPPYIPNCANIIMEETEKIDVVSFVRECYLADAMEDIEIGKTAKE
ncbi:hypothetical protein GIB67_024703 [Kingdonia uniflora]|uniref:non-specific serine/threonine protein kinase n=2 Tax=Kingdonia uniflora TaxID=39325 RepID=A0A7J7M3N0_9MAGN|nr:hypothetical protein GIB67_016994 [Kingdonia uniflora]KAF6149457.1 hypothetical protein GIB67_016995 [Kingdonia uniflora]KAF6163848.1 hypothetical protein GIB67_024703 [Kingdonia uniflora]